MAVRNRINSSTAGVLTAPQWAGKELDSWDLMPGGAKLDEASFTAYTNAVTVTLSANAAAAAVALTVTALAFAIPAGIVLNFGGGKTAFVTAAAAAAATSVTVSPLVNAIASGDAATFGGQYGKHVPSGTFVSRTYAQRAAGTGFHPAVITEDEYYLTAHDVTDLTLDNDVAIVKNGFGPVKENFLPNIAGITAVAAVLASLRAKYVCTLGAE